MKKYRCTKCGFIFEGEQCYCPKCGKPLSFKKKTPGQIMPEEKEYSPFVLREMGHENESNSGVFTLIWGLLLAPAILGIFLIIIGAAAISEGNAQSNLVNKECVYYSSDSKRIKIYTYNAGVYRCQLSDVVSIERNEKNHKLYIYVKEKDKTIKIKGGYSRTPQPLINKRLEELRKRNNLI